MRTTSAVLFTILMGAPLAASAHGDTENPKNHKHEAAPPAGHDTSKDHAHKAPHGGTVASSGNYHLELVRVDGGVELYLLDAAEKTLPPAAMTDARLTVQAGGKKTEVAMAPKEDRMAGTLDASGAWVAVLTAKLDGKPITVRFKTKPAKP